MIISRTIHVTVNGIISFCVCVWLNNIPLVFSSGLGLKNPLAVQEMQVRPLGWEDPLEKEMATYPSILAWEIPWTEEPGRATVHGVTQSQTE